MNGMNGHIAPRPRPVAFTKSPSPSKVSSTSSSSRQTRRDVPFPESSAILRTTEDMSAFLRLDRELDSRLNGQLLTNGFNGPSLEERLRDYAVVGMELDGEEAGFMAMDVDVGEKRKL